MRRLCALAVLPTLALAGGLPPAAAQDVASSAQTDNAWYNPPTSEVRQPTLAAPGTVMGVRLGELYTDNLGLAGLGQSKQGSWITVFTPFVKAAHVSPRFTGMLDWHADGYLYAGHGKYNQLAQNLRATGTFALLPQHLFLAGTASYARGVINNEAPAPSGTFFLGGNQVNIAVGQISPYWLQQLGRVGTLTLRYVQGRVVYNHHGISGNDKGTDPLAGVSNVGSRVVDVSLVSPEDMLWGWNLMYDRQRLQPEHGHSLQFATAKIGISHELGRSMRVLADAGKENRYLADGSMDELGATLWDVGLQWNMANNFLKVLGGHRFYGSAYQFLWTHQAALLTTQVRYDEQPTDLNQQLLDSNPGEALTIPRNPVGIPSLLQRGVYLLKQASAAASYEMPKGQLKASVYAVSRHYFLLGSRNEKVLRAQLGWQLDLSPSMTFTPSFGWRRYLFQDGTVSYRRRIGLDLRQQVNPDDIVTLRLRRGISDSHAAPADVYGYRIDVIYLQWTHLFRGS